MGLIIYFMFETQINYMWSLKKFKMNEILHATNFCIICSPSFPLNYLYRTMHLPMFYMNLFES
jgi:hypothetical protein